MPNNGELKPSPHSKEAEEAILGGIIMEGAAAFERVVPWIREDKAFYLKDNKIIWEVMQTLHKEREEIDAVTINNKLRSMFPDERLGYHISVLLSETLSAENIETYARIVWERHIQRETAKSAQRLYQTSFNAPEETKAMLDQHSRLVDELKTLNPSKKRDVESIVSESIEFIKEGGNIIPFGNIALDVPAGGMTRKEVTCIGGRPGHGKTTLVINIIRCLVDQGFKVMMFNREMSNSEMMKKMFVMESESLSYEYVRRGNLTDAMTKELDYVSEKVQNKYKNQLSMYDDISSLDEALIEVSRYKPDVVIDDYIQLISMPSKMERRFQIEKIMQDYKWVCKKENCSALLISQLNRNMETRADPRPKMSDYAESGVIEQTVESAMSIFYGFNFDDTRFSRYESEIISVKTRYGRVGTCRVGFNGNRCKFYASAEEAQNDNSTKHKDKATPWLQ